MGQQNVAGLFAAQRGIVLLHLFEDVTVAHRGPQHPDAGAAQSRLKAHVGHGSGHHQIAGQQAARLQIAGGDQQDGVAIDHVVAGAGQHAAVGIAIEGEADLRAAGGGLRGDVLGMQCAAILIDIAAVGRNVQQLDCAAQTAEEFRGDSGGGAIGAVGHNLQALERESGNRVDQKLDVVGLQRGVVHDGRQAGRVGSLKVGGMAQNLFFHGQFDGVGQFEAIGTEELDAVVLPGIVRGADDHAGGESVAADQKGDGGGGDDAGAFHRGSGFPQSGGQRSGDPGTGFAGVAAQKHARFDAVAGQRVAQRQTNCIDGGGVEWILTGGGANAVCTEKRACSFLAHDLSCSLAAADSIRLVKTPSCIRVRTRSPAASCAAERIRVPSSFKTSA